MARDARGSYQFGPFRLFADGTLLVRDGDAIPLPPKVLQTLLVLVQRAGEVVRKEELLQAVWPDSFVEETGLTRNISVLRHALGPEGSGLIVTVARVGYRFAGAVRRVTGEDAHTAGPRQVEERSSVEHRQIVRGRDRELSKLRDGRDRARGGRGSLMAIVGEPGIGKTTVVECFLAEQSETVLIGRGRCSERLAGAEPHLPVLEALHALTAGSPDLVATLWRTAPTWADYVAPRERPVRPGDAPPDDPRPGSAERLMRELTAFLDEAGRWRPIVMFLDDLHWTDTSTVDVLAHLAPRLTRLRVLLVVTYREREMLLQKHAFARLRGDLIARGHLVEVHVTLLGRADVRDYVQASLADVDSLDDVATLVFERTEGNPLFMTELVRHLRTRGVAADGQASPHRMLDSLRGMIARALEDLEPQTRTLVAIGAIQGPEFDSATLSAVAGIDPAEVEERLRIADTVHGLVQLTGDRELPDGTHALAYRSVHVLYQEALIDAVPPSRRADWARRIANALLESHAGATDAIASSLAILFEASRDFWKASEWLLITSRNATRHFAFAAASDLAARGLTCLTSVRGVDVRQFKQRELDLRFARLVPLASIEGYGSSEVGRLTDEVIALADELGDVPATTAALSATWIVRMVRGECVAARDAGTRLASIGEAAANEVLSINAHMHAQIACHHMGKFQEAAKHAAAVSALAGRSTPKARCIGILDPVVASLAESARNNWITGHLSNALADCENAVVVGREVRHPDSLAFAWLFHGWIHGYRNDWSTCLASTASGITTATESGSVQTLAWNRCVRGWALAHVGDATTGETELAAAIESSRAIMGQVALPQFEAMTAEVLLLRGDVSSAAACLERAKALERSQDDRYFTAEVHRLSAACLARAGSQDAARARLYEALGLARSQGAATFALRAALDLWELDRQEGTGPLRAALASFPQPVEDWPEIRRARTVLETALS